MFNKITKTLHGGIGKIGKVLKGVTNPFGSNYDKFAENRVFGSITVRQGERAALWTRNGQLQILEGPQQRYCKFETVQFLEQHVADPAQYLDIVLKTGENEYRSGPVSTWFDPQIHHKIELRYKSRIATNEAMVCYKTGTDGNTIREILQGPLLYSPTGTAEWMHQFKWHYPEQVQENKGLTQSGVLRFSTVRLLPDHMYFDVPNVRTKDDALIRVKTMIFFHCEDLEKTLDSTHDPINVMINGMIADIMVYTANKELDHFKDEQKELNELSSYPELTKRADNIGYKVSKVVFRGFESDKELQEMHDNAIKKRTEIQLEKEQEKAKQELTHFVLDAQIARNEQQEQLDQDKHKQQLKLMKQTHSEQINNIININNEKLRYYKYMKEELDCDVADIIKYESQNNQNTKTIRIDANDGNATSIHTHFDDNTQVVAKSSNNNDDDDSD